MIKVLVLDDSYHDKEAVMFYDNKTLLKTSLAYFINIHLCIPHHEDYQVKTAHYEDMEDNYLVKIFEELSRIRHSARINDEDLVRYFQKLYDSDEAIEGCDIY